LVAIDGAVLIDPSGQCHGIGAILDGQAAESWDASRGSRYNSALRYVSTRQREGHRCLAVVISEDGMINLLPQLDPKP
jgi:DNA integrity scanning protein DisA with diadenylate cyclase activity